MSSCMAKEHEFNSPGPRPYLLVCHLHLGNGRYLINVLDRLPLMELKVLLGGILNRNCCQNTGRIIKENNE
jgi:hypothetical protein